MASVALYKGDNTAAFGGLFIRINLHLPPALEDIVITKAVVSINVDSEIVSNSISKTFSNPTFPLDINLDSTETKKLRPINHVYLAVWDSDNRKRTATGSFSFDALGQKVAD